MIRSDAGRCPVSAQCGILGVAKSTCYWVLEHPEAERADPYEKDVERVWRDSGKVYGARKIRHALGHEGDAVPPPHQPDHEGERHGRLLFQGRL